MQSLYSSYFSPLSNPKLTIVASSYQIETRISFKKWLDTRIIEKNSSWILQIRNDNALFRIESRKDRLVNLKENVYFHTHFSFYERILMYRYNRNKNSFTSYNILI